MLYTKFPNTIYFLSSSRYYTIQMREERKTEEIYKLTIKLFFFYFQRHLNVIILIKSTPNEYRI